MVGLLLISFFLPLDTAGEEKELQVIRAATFTAVADRFQNPNLKPSL